MPDRCASQVVTEAPIRWTSSANMQRVESEEFDGGFGPAWRRDADSDAEATARILGDTAASLDSTARESSVLVRPIDLRAFVQQKPRRVDVARQAGGIHGRRTILIRLVDRRA